jgi:PEP-CTERM motif
MSKFWLGCAILGLLFSYSGSAEAQLYTVDAYRNGYDAFDVYGTFEFDGTSYSNWSITSEFGPEDDWLYTAGNSAVLTTNPFSLPVPQDAQNFGLYPTAPDLFGHFWLTFETALTDLLPGEVGALLSGNPDIGGSYDSRYIAPYVQYVPLIGTVTREGGLDPIPEPTSIMLLGIGLFGVALIGRKKHLKK